MLKKSLAFLYGEFYGILFHRLWFWRQIVEIFTMPYFSKTFSPPWCSKYYIILHLNLWFILNYFGKTHERIYYYFIILANEYIIASANTIYWKDCTFSNELIWIFVKYLLEEFYYIELLYFWNITRLVACREASPVMESPPVMPGVQRRVTTMILNDVIALSIQCYHLANDVSLEPPYRIRQFMVFHPLGYLL